jgi:hypothetical protein
MNLIKAAELLKGAPDSELAQYLQNPTGEFPEYLVASEKLRREDMRKKYAAANQGQPTKTSIIEELLQKDNQQMRQQQPQQMPQQVPPEAMGLGAVPPPEGMQLTPSPMMEAAQQPQQFYDGGVVALAGGGPAYSANPADFAIDPSIFQNEAIPEVHDLSYYQNQAKEAYGPSGLESYQDALAKQRANLAANKKNYLSDFLIQSGLGMATSKGNLLQAAAEGATQGFKLHQQSKLADEQADRNLTDSEFKFKQAERAERAGLFGLSRQLYNDAYSQRNVGMDNRRAAEQLKLTGAANLNDARYKAATLANEDRRLGIQAAGAGSEAAFRQAQIENFKARQNLLQEQLKLRGQPKPMSGKDKLAAVTSIQRYDPQYAALKASLEKAAKKDPALQYTIQGQLDEYINNQLNKYGDVYTAADLMGSD